MAVFPSCTKAGSIKSAKCTLTVVGFSKVRFHQEPFKTFPILVKCNQPKNSAQHQNLE